MNPEQLSNTHSRAFLSLKNVYILFKRELDPSQVLFKQMRMTPV